MKVSLYIGVIVALQLAISMATQLLIVRSIGIGDTTDSYFAAQAIPSVLLSIIVSALQAAWLPRLSIASNSNELWRNELSTALGQATLAGGFIFIMIVATIHNWISIVYPGFSTSQLESTVYFTYIILAATFFNIQSAILTISLRSKDLFVTAESINLLSSGLSFVAVFITLPIWGLFSAAWIILIRSILTYTFQLKLVNWSLPSLSKGLKSSETWSLIRPLLWGNSLLKTSPLVDRYWASKAPTGSITIFNLTQTIIFSLAAIAERSFSTTVTTSFSKHVANKDYLGLKKSYRRGFLKITMFTLVIGLIFISTKSLFISTSSKALHLQLSDSEKIWDLLSLSLGYLHAVVSGSLLVAVYYALNDTRKPMYIGVFGFLISLVLKLIGFNYWSLNGLAAASSIYLLINIFFYFYYLELKIKKLQKETNHEH